MDQFLRWLEQNGFKHTRGDMHWAGAGWWYPELPDVTTGEAAPKPPEPWIHVERDRENPAVFIGASFAEGIYAEDTAKAQTKIEELLMRFDEAAGGGSLAGVYPTKGANVGRKVRVVTWSPPFTGRVHSATDKWLIVRDDETKQLITVTLKDVKFLDEGKGTLHGFAGHDSDVSQACDGGNHARCTGGSVCDCSCHQFDDRRITARCSDCSKPYSQKKFKDLPFIGAETVKGEFVESRMCGCGGNVVVTG